MGTTRDTTGTDDRHDDPAARRRLVSASGLHERRVRLAGIDTAVLEGGEGPPLVLLHGLGEYWAVWLAVIQRLREDCRIVAVDLPGHGASGVGDGRLDRSRMLDWTGDLLDTVGQERPVLAGHLLGGAVAARYAVDHGDRMAHLLLVDTFGLAWYRPRWQFLRPMMRFLARPDPETRDRLFQECFVDFDRVGANFGERWDDLRDLALDGAREPQSQAAVRSLLLKVGMAPLPRADRDRIPVPTTLVHGRHDLQVPLRAARRASEAHGWPLHVIEEARDDPAAEQPDEVAAIIRGLLDGAATAA